MKVKLFILIIDILVQELKKNMKKFQAYLKPYVFHEWGKAKQNKDTPQNKQKTHKTKHSYLFHREDLQTVLLTWKLI